MANNVRQGSFHISSVDRLGRKIDPIVLAAAQEIGQRAVEHAERLLGDPALAISLLEETAAVVSRVLTCKGQTSTAGIRNLHGYILRAFVRRVNRARRKELALVKSTKTNPAQHPGSADLAKEFQLKVLVDELLTRCDPITRDMFYRRVQGFSWKEIGAVYGISSHAAESRFGQALRRVRRWLGIKR